MAWPCRYWIVICDTKKGPKPVTHNLCVQIRWSSTGWSDYTSQYDKKHLVERIGPFDSRTQMLSYYWDNKSSLYGGNNAWTIDMSDRTLARDCQDQV
jgi:hypothetical protein